MGRSLLCFLEAHLSGSFETLNVSMQRCVFINNLTNRSNKSFLFNVKKGDGLLMYVAGQKNTTIEGISHKGMLLVIYPTVGFHWRHSVSRAALGLITVCITHFFLGARIYTKCGFEWFQSGVRLLQGQILVGTPTRSLTVSPGHLWIYLRRRRQING